jgi:hypothetical protein
VREIMRVLSESYFLQWWAVEYKLSYQVYDAAQRLKTGHNDFRFLFWR